jgi:N-acetylglucosaminyldiphosphoundecaprenol N-acetyl-beta-D-mannosaminyltransferase
VSVNLQQFSILGQPIHLCTDYWTWLLDRADRGIGTHVVTMNAEMVMQARHSPDLAQILQRADLIAADGAGIVMALQLHGLRQQRCAGIDLGAMLLDWAGSRGGDCPVALYGGRPEVLTRAVAYWQQRQPQLHIVANRDGYINAAQQLSFLDELVALQPRLVLVALGIPRQEQWISQNRHRLPHTTFVGVGGSFDVWSGTKKRAPQVWQKLNLEWLYRLGQEPSRWRRMLALPQFLGLAVAERLGIFR